MDRIQHLALLLACAVPLAACEQPDSSKIADPPPELYRSKTEALYQDFEGVEAELRSALLERDLLVRVESVARVLQKLGPDSVQQVLDTYETVWMDLGQTELELLGEWWTRFDPHAAIEWAESDMRTAGAQVPYAVMRSWATRDPGAALSRSLQGNMRDPMMKHKYQAAVIDGWEESGRQEVFDYIRDLGPGESRQRAIRGFARRTVLREGPERAFAWADALPEDDKLFKLNVMRRIAQHAAKEDPVKTAAWAEKYEGTYFFRSLPQRIAIQWAREDPVAMMAWLKTLEDSRDRDEGMREGFRGWARRFYDDAVAWLESEPHERYKDEAVALVARRLQIGQPERAIEMAREIVNEDLRVGTLVTIARTWGVQDKIAAEEWVHSDNSLTEQQKKLALTYGERWRMGVLAAAERRARLDDNAAEQRMEDMSDPDNEDDFTVRELLGEWEEPTTPQKQQEMLRKRREAEAKLREQKNSGQQAQVQSPQTTTPTQQ